MRFRDGLKAPMTITLDLDSHVTTVYGSQQRAGAGYNPKKKGRKSYHPLLCFIGETRDYMGGLLRSGKRHTSYNAVQFLKGIMKKLPSHMEKIRLRADSGFFSLDMIEFLVRKTIDLTVVVPMQPWVHLSAQAERKIRHIRDWRNIDRGLQTAECEYVITKDKAIRMVVARQPVCTGRRVRSGASPRKQLKLLSTEDVLYDYQVIATNSSIEPVEVWRFYNKRACCENFIKEGIYPACAGRGFGLDRPACADRVVSHGYAGNSAWFEILMLAYNLMNFFKEEVLRQKGVKEMIQTIRERLFLIPGRLVRGARRLVLRLESTWFYRREYEEAPSRVA